MGPRNRIFEPYRWCRVGGGVFPPLPSPPSQQPLPSHAKRVACAHAFTMATEYDRRHLLSFFHLVAEYIKKLRENYHHFYARGNRTPRSLGFAPPPTPTSPLQNDAGRPTHTHTLLLMRNVFSLSPFVSNDPRPQPSEPASAWACIHIVAFLKDPHHPLSPTHTHTLLAGDVKKVQRAGA